MSTAQAQQSSTARASVTPPRDGHRDELAMRRSLDLMCERNGNRKIRDASMSEQEGKPLTDRLRLMNAQQCEQCLRGFQPASRSDRYCPRCVKIRREQGQRGEPRDEDGNDTE